MIIREVINYEAMGLDENIKDIIIELNEKGYETMYSCESHRDKFIITCIYIRFAKEYKLKPPKWFKFEDGTDIVYVNQNKISEARKQELLDSLRKWAFVLPKLK